MFWLVFFLSAKVQLFVDMSKSKSLFSLILSLFNSFIHDRSCLQRQRRYATFDAGIKLRDFFKKWHMRLHMSFFLCTFARKSCNK